MQPINATATVPGATGASLIEGWRDAQAAMRALRRIAGQEGGTAPESSSARPVMAIDGPERGKILTATPPEVGQRLREDRDAPTGPRPTFERTPLEQMRSNAMEPQALRNAKSLETKPVLALGRWDTALSKGAYSAALDRGTRRVEETNIRLDIKT